MRVLYIKKDPHLRLWYVYYIPTIYGGFLTSSLKHDNYTEPTYKRARETYNALLVDYKRIKAGNPLINFVINGKSVKVK